jgi:AAA15 family ATPase/GTPase
MLLKFYCSNFKSIKDEIEFSMFSGSYKRHESHIVSYKDKGVLRASAIYGTNGSGKTNIFLALHFLHKLVVKGTRDINEKLNVPVFKLSDCKTVPTKFELDFLIDSKRYAYNLEILSDIITKEELFEIKDTTEIIIFKRKKDGKKISLTIAPNKDKNPKEKLREEIYAEELRDNQTFFNEAINKKLTEVDIPFGWFKNKLRFISVDSQGGVGNDHLTTGLASTFFLDKEFLEASKSIITQAKVGISDFKLEEQSLSDIKGKGFKFPLNLEADLMNRNDLNVDFTFEGELYSSIRKNGELSFVKISTTHENTDHELVEFKFSEESKGVQRLFFLLPAIYRSLHRGEVFIVDEIETSFHPVLIKEILQLYLDTTPVKAGQIIFTTHESHLLDLDLFRQDEIWFCEKDKIGGTKLYSLGEFKPRFDKDIRKGYLEGQFGYIPFLGDSKNLGL